MDRVHQRILTIRPFNDRLKFKLEKFKIRRRGMGPNKDCIDIVTELGGVTDGKAAQKVFEDTIDAVNLDKLKRIQNPDALKKNCQCHQALSTGRCFYRYRIGARPSIRQGAFVKKR
jgi:hypothetical protein